MAPPMAGMGVRSFSEARRHSKGLWRHNVCQSAAAATLQIKGGGAAQGAHPPPGPPDGHASTKLFFAKTNLAGRSVPGSGGLLREEATQTRRCCGGENKTFSGHCNAGHSYGAAAGRGRSAGRPVSCKGHDKLRNAVEHPLGQSSCCPT